MKVHTQTQCTGVPWITEKLLVLRDHLEKNWLKRREGVFITLKTTWYFTDKPRRDPHHHRSHQHPSMRAALPGPQGSQLVPNARSWSQQRSAAQGKAEEPTGWAYSPDPTGHRREGSEACTLVCLRASRVPRPAGSPQCYHFRNNVLGRLGQRVLMFYKK